MKTEIKTMLLNGAWDIDGEAITDDMRNRKDLSRKCTDDLLSHQTDYERTKELLDYLGVLYGEDHNFGVRELAFGNPRYSSTGFPSCNTVDGYEGFYTCFEFDENGKFLRVGAWE